MNLIQFPILSPLKFHASTNIDNINNFPIPDFARPEFDIFPNRTNLSYYFPVIKGENLVFQLMKTGTITIRKYKSDGTITTLTGIETNITPAYWAGGKNVYKYTVPFADEGSFKILINIVSGGITEVYESDWIYVKETHPDLIKINYYHTSNEFGTVFATSSTNIVFQPYIFVFGEVFDSQLTLDLNNAQTDRGNIIRLQSTPKQIFNIKIDLIPIWLRSTIQFIFACKNVVINNLNVQLVDSFEFEQNSDFADTSSATIKVQVKDFDYLHKDFDFGTGVIVTDDNDDLIGNNSEIILQ